LGRDAPIRSPRPAATRMARAVIVHRHDERGDGSE
jgi:hypothetical protein